MLVNVKQSISSFLYLVKTRITLELGCLLSRSMVCIKLHEHFKSEILICFQVEAWVNMW